METDADDAAARLTGKRKCPSCRRQVGVHEQEMLPGSSPSFGRRFLIFEQHLIKAPGSFEMMKVSDNRCSMSGMKVSLP